jgi:hypothetical protein
MSPSGALIGQLGLAAALAVARPAGQYAALPSDHGSVAARPDFATAITDFLSGGRAG